MNFHLRLVIPWVSFLCVSKVFYFHSSVKQDSWRARFLQAVPSAPLSPCKVLISNHRVEFHTEILESIIALLPLSSLPLPETCDRNNLEFDFIVRGNRQSWMEYFNDEMVNKAYHGTQPGQKRVARNAVFANGKDSSYIVPIKAKYSATIEASCYCTDEMVEMMSESPDTVCIFHEGCDQLVDNPRAFWVSPHHDRYIFPSVLPMPATHLRSSPNLPLDLCVIGSTGRRNFNLLSDFLGSMDPKQTKRLVRINLLGKGEFPEPLNDYRNITRQQTIIDFVEYQNTIASRCDVLLPLVDTKKNGDYFDKPGKKKAGKKKLSGSIVQAVAYSIPMVVHEEISQLYEKEHPPGTPWETHTNDPRTFTVALKRLVETLGNVSIATAATSQSNTPAVKKQ